MKTPVRIASPRLLSALALVLAAASILAVTGSANSTRAQLSGVGLKEVDSTLCRIVKFPGLAAATDFALGRLSKGAIKGGLVGPFVITSIQKYCDYPRHRELASRVVNSVLNRQRRPSTENSVRRLNEVYAQQQAEQIAAQLRALNPNWSARNVRSLVGSICRDLRLYRDPISRDLSPALPGARLGMLGAVSGIVSSTLRCKPALNVSAVDYFSGAAYNYLVSNTYPRDFEPPSTFFLRFENTRYTDRVTRVRFSWIGFDRHSGISSFVLYRSVNGAQWAYDNTFGETQTEALAKIREGSTYQFALQAIDDSGNRSAWAYSGVGRA